MNELKDFQTRIEKEGRECFLQYYRNEYGIKKITTNGASKELASNFAEFCQQVSNLVVEELEIFISVDNQEYSLELVYPQDSYRLPINLKSDDSNSVLDYLTQTDWVKIISDAVILLTKHSEEREALDESIAPRFIKTKDIIEQTNPLLIELRPLLKRKHKFLILSLPPFGLVDEPNGLIVDSYPRNIKNFEENLIMLLGQGMHPFAVIYNKKRLSNSLIDEMKNELIVKSLRRNSESFRKATGMVQGSYFSIQMTAEAYGQ